MRFLKVSILCLTVASISSGQYLTGQALPGQSLSSATDSAGRLPVTRVILYKNGVGYFEHAGRVRDSQDVNVDFTTAQLNDVLKSLTVLDLGKGRITGISYNSNAPLERRLGSLHLAVGENPTTAQFLDALRGARLEVRSGSESASGRLLSIDEREIPIKGDQKVTVDQISIISDSGEVRVFDLTPTTSVRVAEKDVNDEVGKYLGLVASTRDQDVRRMTISTAGEGERGLLVSYISEVPVWKSTYRIVIPNEGKPLLQGWAIVDNTVGEDWKNVELSLVAGAPQSFVQQLSQPYYARRPVVPLPENAMITPQTHEATMEAQTDVVNGQLTMPTRVPAGVVGGVPGGIPGGQIGGPINGKVSSAPMALKANGAGGGVGGGMYRPNAGNSKQWLAEDVEHLEAATTTAQTRDLGDLFEYKLQDKVTIRKNQSALVPILQARIDAEKVSVWNPSQTSVLRALWLDNTSALTFDGGSFNVLEGDAFAGEGLMDPIKPGEKRLLSYAADLGVLVDARQKAENQRVTRVFIAHGLMTQSTQEREENTYTIRNRDTSQRTVVIEHPARPGWKLTDDEKPAESSASFHRFRITVDSKKTETLLVKEYRPVTNSYQLSNVTDDQIKFFLAQKMINPEIEQALRKVIAQKSSVALLDAEVGSRKSKISGISEDQQRVRENMKALKGSVEEKALVARYVRELNEQEDHVQSLQHEVADLQQKREAAQKTLNDMIEGLQMEATL
jgi:archaellum component FlaC